jgi:hypothetical protein
MVTAGLMSAETETMDGIYYEQEKNMDNQNKGNKTKQSRRGSMLKGRLRKNSGESTRRFQEKKMSITPAVVGWG